MERESRSVIILGAQSAIAEALARCLAAQNDRLLLVGRNAERLEVIASHLRVLGARDVLVRCHDLADPTSGGLEHFANWVSDLGGRVDAVAICHGVLGNQMHAQSDLQQTVKIVQVNFASAVLWATLAALQFDRQGYGRLLVVGSVAGDRGRRTNYVYGSTKAGLVTFVQGLNHRFAGRDIRAVLVKPGLIDTPMTDGMDKSSPLWATPDVVAQVMVRALDGGHEVVYAPRRWFIIMSIIKVLPRWLFNRLSI